MAYSNIRVAKSQHFGPDPLRISYAVVKFSRVDFSESTWQKKRGSGRGGAFLFPIRLWFMLLRLLNRKREVGGQKRASWYWWKPVRLNVWFFDGFLASVCVCVRGGRPAGVSWHGDGIVISPDVPSCGPYLSSWSFSSEAHFLSTSWIKGSLY